MMEEAPVCAAGATEKCLFCAIPLPPSFTIVNGEINRLKKETADHDDGDEDDCLPSTSCSFLSTEDSPLDKQLEVVFILKNVLQIPEKKLHQFLKQFGGQLHPEFWCQVCSLCAEPVQQFYETLKEITKLKKRLNRISKQLKGRIYNTKEAEGAENGLTCIWEEIRAEVLKDFQEVHVSEPQQGSFQEEENLEDSEQIPASPGSSTPSDFDPDEKGDESSTSDFEPDLGDDDSDSSKETESEDEDYKPVQVKRGVNKKRKPKSKSPPKRKQFLPKNVTRHNANFHPEEKANKKRIKGYYTKCPNCPARSTDTAFMKKHIQLHEPSNEVECTTCESCGWLVKACSLKRHLSSRHHDKRIERHKRDDAMQNDKIPYYCDHCQMIFTKKMHLQRHFRLYHADQKEFAVCSQPDCHEKFESRQLLAFHLQNIHPNLQTEEEHPEEEGDQKCLHCELTFNSKMKVDYHIASLHKDVLLTCTTCNVKTNSFKNYRLHMEQTDVHANSPSFFCEHCGVSFWSDLHLQRHRRHHHFSELETDPCQCQECGLIFCRKGVLKIHIKTVHRGEKNYTCEYCGRAFSRVSNYEAHLRAFHKGPLGTPVIPDGKHFRLEKKDGNGVETWLCDFCPMTFANLMAVRTHLLKTHYDQLTHICEGCSKKFCASLGLQKHRKRCEELKTKGDNEEKPDVFHCRFCPKQFFSYGTCGKHERAIHADKHSHLCQCGKAFKNFGTLALHQNKCAVAFPPETGSVDVAE